MPLRSWGHLEDLIVLARAVGHLDGDLVADLGLRDFLMVHFHRADRLGEVGRVAVKSNAVSHRQGALGHAHDGDARSLEIVDYGPHQLLRHRPSSDPSSTTISRAASGAATRSPPARSTGRDRPGHGAAGATTACGATSRARSSASLPAPPE